MRNCEWEIISEQPIQVKCIHCGTIRTNPNLKRSCNKQDHGMLSMAARFAKEYTKWKINGGEYRPDEEIDRIYNDICSGCEFFAPNKASKKYGSCKICGCHLKDSKDKSINKLAMATTNCPHDPPKWVAVEGAVEREQQLIAEAEKEAAQSGDKPAAPPPKKKKGCGCGR